MPYILAPAACLSSLNRVPWNLDASKCEEHSAPFWLWPNLLSLDAPLVAVLWQSFLAYRFSIPLPPAAPLVLGLTVWAVYLLDRLLDARRPASVDEPARHRFYRRHSRLMLALLVLVAAADAAFAVSRLRPVILLDGLIPLAGVLVYLAVFHIWNPSSKIPKEVAAAILFTAGTFLTAWTTPRRGTLAWAAVAFFLLCLANMVAIEAWEWRENSAQIRLHPITHWLARTYLCWVTLAVITCVLEAAITGHSEWYTSIAVSAGACGLLFWFGRRVPLEARRALVDGVLLSPLFFLIVR